jgi:hypothetical protein
MLHEAGRTRFYKFGSSASHKALSSSKTAGVDKTCTGVVLTACLTLSAAPPNVGGDVQFRQAYAVHQLPQFLTECRAAILRVFGRRTPCRNMILVYHSGHFLCSHHVRLVSALLSATFLLAFEMKF